MISEILRRQNIKGLAFWGLPLLASPAAACAVLVLALFLPRLSLACTVTSASLDFTGDDYMEVYINGNVASDGFGLRRLQRWPGSEHSKRLA